MRLVSPVLCLGVLAAVLGAVNADEKVEVKGPHICCKQCVNVVGKLLDKVDGVSEVNADAKTKTVTFTAKDEKAAKAGFKALLDGGFFGTATAGGKGLKADIPAVKGAKADSVAVQDVHVCCGQCVSAVKGLFKDTTVTIKGTGAQKTVTIEGKGLDPVAVLEALHKGGFHGTVGK